MYEKVYTYVSDQWRWHQEAQVVTAGDRPTTYAKKDDSLGRATNSAVSIDNSIRNNMKNGTLGTWSKNINKNNRYFFRF